MGCCVGGKRLCRVEEKLCTGSRGCSELRLTAGVFAPSCMNFRAILKRTKVMFRCCSAVFITACRAGRVMYSNRACSFEGVGSAVLAGGTNVRGGNTCYMTDGRHTFLSMLCLGGSCRFSGLTPLSFSGMLTLLPVCGGRQVTGIIRLCFGSFRTSEALL